MLPIPKETKDNRAKNNRLLVCPYCENNPLVQLLPVDAVRHLNHLFNKERKDVPILASDGYIHKRTEDFNYEKGILCKKCKTIWLWEKDIWDTYVGKTVPRTNEVIIIGGKAVPNFLPLKDNETGDYLPLLNPSAPLIKKSD